MPSLCPLCEKGTLSTTLVVENISYSGHALQVPDVEISACDHCHEEIVTPEQAKRNDVVFADAKRAFAGLLVSKELRKAREVIGLTQANAADVFGGGANAFSKYERGEVVQSHQMDLLLRLSIEVPVARDWLLRRSGIAGAWTELTSSVTNYDFTASAKRKKGPTLYTIDDDAPTDWEWRGVSSMAK